MRFRLDPSRSLAEAFRGLLESHSEIARAAAAGITAERDPQRRRQLVRLARKTVKRLRASARLFEVAADALPIDPAPLRAAGRLLSGPRDRHVRGLTLARVTASIRRDLPADLARNLARAIEVATRESTPNDPAVPAPPATRKPTSNDPAVPAVAGPPEPVRIRPPAAVPQTSCLPASATAPNDAESIAAAEASRRIAEWRHLLGSLPFTDLRWRRIRRHLHARWNRLRRRLRNDLRSGDDKRLHACRKSCGRLETMLLMIEATAGPAIARRRARLERIYEDLGDDRDLHLLAGWLRKSSRGSVDPELASLLDAAILARRRRLRRRLARRIGALPRRRRAKWSSVGRGKSRPDAPPGDSPPCAS